ncbi:hypothetical protein AV530_003636 [Patagioenas fasciata monilis]|uniref:Uncharacterized protein n=1 Tax=Patagioenas fasciata monilis TaxID=372326 RepID=A0A1V4KY40_PATFA|nr:hypothetical protein AV530_003636 [Patagioenas fasciata monilis]
MLFGLDLSSESSTVTERKGLLQERDRRKRKRGKKHEQLYSLTGAEGLSIELELGARMRFVLQSLSPSKTAQEGDAEAPCQTSASMQQFRISAHLDLGGL